MTNSITEISNTQVTSGSLWWYCKHEPNNKISDYESFNFKSKFLDNSNNEGVIRKEGVHNWLTFEMSATNCESNFMLT